MENTGNTLIRNYFHDEMAYLRSRAAEFSQDYPDIAAELEMSQGRSADPNIEAMIQSFAFLTGKLQYKLNAEAPQVSNTLLSMLCPHLETPIPSMAIAQFGVDPEGANFSSGFTLHRNQLFFSEGKTPSGEPLNCYFQNCYDTPLWPLKVGDIRVVPRNYHDFLSNRKDIYSVIKVRVENTGSDPINAYNLQSLRFYINGEGAERYHLYDLLLHEAIGVAINSDFREQPYWLPPTAITQQGFQAEQAVLPYSDQSHQGYRYLQEYFAFPEKFLFFDLEFGENVLEASEWLDLFFLFDREIGNPGLTPTSLVLNCFPMINLFSKTTVPIHINHRQYEYKLLPDDRLYRYCEVHTVREVLLKKPGVRQIQASPMFLVDGEESEAPPQVYWTQRREVSQLKSLPGTETWLSFHNPNLNLADPPGELLFAKTLCTNRDLAEKMQAGSLCRLEGGGPGSAAILLSKPTAHQSPPLHGKQPWALISHLSLNHLSLDGGGASAHALKDILKLYASSSNPAIGRQIDSLHALSCQSTVLRVGPDAWRGFCPGKEVVMTIDEQIFKGGSPLLFAEVLSRFFAMYASLHSFTQLVLKSRQREGEWQRWPARVGEQIIL